MLRVFIDAEGGGHADLFLKIDVMPGYLRVADTYFLSSFLAIGEDELEHMPDQHYKAHLTSLLIRHWLERVKALEKGQETFLIVDLSDQYIGGLNLTKVKRGYSVKALYTTDVQGCGVTFSTLDEQLNNATFKEYNEGEWLIGEVAVLAGLQWSLAELTDQLKKPPRPLIPQEAHNRW